MLTRIQSSFSKVGLSATPAIIMEASETQLLHLKELPNTYVLTMGLKVNYNRSMMIRAEMLIDTFGCIKGSLPFTYLGLPLGIIKLAVHDYLPWVKNFEARLLVVSNWLTQAGRLLLVNSVLSSLPTFLHVYTENPKDCH